MTVRMVDHRLLAGSTAEGVLGFYLKMWAIPSHLSGRLTVQRSRVPDCYNVRVYGQRFVIELEPCVTRT